MNWLPVKYAWFLLAVALAGLMVWGGMGLTRVAYMALEKWGNAAPESMQPTTDKLNATLDFINRPCASVDKDGHLLPDGPICELDEAIHDIRKITTASGKQVQQTGVLLDAAATGIQSVTASAKGTLDAGTGLERQATATLRTVNDRTPALLDAYTASGRDLDALIQENSPSVRTVLQNTASMTGSGAAILADGKIVSDKITYDYTHPVKWYQQPWKLVTLGVDAMLLAK